MGIIYVSVCKKAGKGYHTPTGLWAPTTMTNDALTKLKTLYGQRNQLDPEDGPVRWSYFVGQSVSLFFGRPTSRGTGFSGNVSTSPSATLFTSGQ